MKKDDGVLFMSSIYSINYKKLEFKLEINNNTKIKKYKIKNKNTRENYIANVDAFNCTRRGRVVGINIIMISLCICVCVLNGHSKGIRS